MPNSSGGPTPKKVQRVYRQTGWTPIPTEPVKINHIKKKTLIPQKSQESSNETTQKKVHPFVMNAEKIKTEEKALKPQISLPDDKTHIEPSMDSSNKPQKNVYQFVIDAQEREAKERSNRLETLRRLSTAALYKNTSNEWETWDSIYPTKEDAFDSNNPTTRIGFLNVCKTLRNPEEFKLSVKNQESSKIMTPKGVDRFIEALERYEKLFHAYEETLSMNKWIEDDLFAAAEKTSKESATGDTLSVEILKSISMYLIALNIVRRDDRKLLDVPLLDSETLESNHSQPLKTWLDLIEYTDRSHPLFLELFKIPPSTKKSSYENPPPSLGSASNLEPTSEQKLFESSNVLINELTTIPPLSSGSSKEVVDPLEMHKILSVFFLFLKTPLAKNLKSLCLAVALKKIEFSYSIFCKAPPVIVTHFLLYSNFFIRRDIFQAVSDSSILFSWLEQAFKNNWKDEAANEFLRTFAPSSRNSFLEYCKEHASEELNHWISKNYKAFFDDIFEPEEASNTCAQPEEVSNSCGCYCS
jgi:hypothetical protein